MSPVPRVFEVNPKQCFCARPGPTRILFYFWPRDSEGLLRTIILHDLTGRTFAPNLSGAFARLLRFLRQRVLERGAPKRPTKTWCQPNCSETKGQRGQASKFCWPTNWLQWNLAVPLSALRSSNARRNPNSKTLFVNLYFVSSYALLRIICYFFEQFHKNFLSNASALVFLRSFLFTVNSYFIIYLKKENNK